MCEQALAVAKDPEHRFDLAIQLGKLNIAYEIADTLNQDEKWKIVGDRSLSKWQVISALSQFSTD